jgi:hypothetical protein
MPNIGTIKVCIPGKERDASLPAQKQDNFLVLQSLVTNVHANLAHSYTRSLQYKALPFKDVFVKDDQN